MKVKTTLIINKKLLEKAKDLGINLSKAFEKTLENLIEAMENAYSTEKAKIFLGEASFLKKVQCGGWDLNPRTPTGQAPEACAFDQARRPPRFCQNRMLL